MRGSPAVPGGPLTSKPTWPNAAGRSATSVFFRPTVALTSGAPGGGMVIDPPLPQSLHRPRPKENVNHGYPCCRAGVAGVSACCRSRARVLHGLARPLGEQGGD